MLHVPASGDVPAGRRNETTVSGSGPIAVRGHSPCAAHGHVYFHFWDGMAPGITTGPVGALYTTPPPHGEHGAEATTGAGQQDAAFFFFRPQAEASSAIAAHETRVSTPNTKVRILSYLTGVRTTKVAVPALESAGRVPIGGHFATTVAFAGR